MYIKYNASVAFTFKKLIVLFFGDNNYVNHRILINFTLLCYFCILYTVYRNNWALDLNLKIKILLHVTKFIVI